MQVASPLCKRIETNSSIANMMKNRYNVAVYVEKYALRNELAWYRKGSGT